MKLLLTTATIAVLAVATTGCATKKYVRKTVDPVNQQVTELEKRSAENALAIKDLDEKTQRQINRVDERAGSADTKAVAAGQRAEQAGASARQAGAAATQAMDKASGAQTLAESGIAKTGHLERVVENLDNFHQTGTKTVYFGFNKSEIDDENKQQLDELAGSLASQRRFVIEVQGYTDGTGSDQYNYVLSGRRADAVVRYLATQHKVPVYRIHTVALGKDVPAEDNKTREGRKMNRRVEVRVYVPKTPDGTQVARQ